MDESYNDGSNHHNSDEIVDCAAETGRATGRRRWNILQRLSDGCGEGAGLCAETNGKHVFIAEDAKHRLDGIGERCAPLSNWTSEPKRRR